MIQSELQPASTFMVLNKIVPPKENYAGISQAQFLSNTVIEN